MYTYFIDLVLETDHYQGSQEFQINAYFGKNRIHIENGQKICI